MATPFKNRYLLSNQLISTVRICAGRSAQPDDQSEVDPPGGAVAFVGLLRGITAPFLIDSEGVVLDTGRTTVVQFARHTLAPTAQGKGNGSDGI